MLYNSKEKVEKEKQYLDMCKSNRVAGIILCSGNVESNKINAGDTPIVLLEKNFDGIKFLKTLLSGEYQEYKYDKNLIGIYKKIAASLLAYMAEPLDEGDDDLIKEFTETLIGSRFTKDLEIYDRFHVEEVKEESSEELYSDNEETLAEENSKKTSDASESKEDETSQDDKDANQ